MAKQAKKGLCVICKKEEVFSSWVGEDDEFDKCQDCAKEYADKLRNEFISALTPEQLVLFEKYQEAEQDCVSMAILVD
ncbi:MAG: hypothetical protein WA064_03370 [Candidatus Moraniibacteriota bacterium]